MRLFDKTKSPRSTPAATYEAVSSLPNKQRAFDANPFLAALTEPLRSEVLGLFDEGREYCKDDVLDVKAEKPPLYLIGRFCCALVTWAGWPYHASGVLMLGDVLGAGERTELGASHASADRLVSAQIMVPRGTVYTASPDRVEALLNGPRAAEFRALLRNLARSTWLAGAPALTATVNSLRMQMAGLMTEHVAKPGEVIVERGHRVPQMFVVAPYGRIRVERFTKEGKELPAIELGFGCTFAAGVKARNDQSARVVAIEETSYFLLNAVPVKTRMWRGTDPLAVEMRRLHDLVQGLIDHSEFIVDSLAADRLFTDVPRWKLYLLLQSAWLVRWRATLPAPSPIGDIPGVSVVLSGGVFSYRQRAPTRKTSLTSSGPIFETLDSYGPGRVLGQRSVIEQNPLIAHWQARLASEVAFINAKRIDDVLGDDEAYRRNVATGKVRFAQGAALTELQSFDRPALLMAIRTDGLP